MSKVERVGEFTGVVGVINSWNALNARLAELESPINSLFLSPWI